MGRAEPDEFVLDVALGEVVLELESRGRLPAAELGHGLGAGGVPGGHVREADVAHLALTDQVVEGSHYLFSRGQAIPGVEDVEIDVVGTEPFEGALDGAQNVLATVAPGVGIAGCRRCN